MVRIQRISRDSQELWANCVKSGSFAPFFLGSLSMVIDLKLTRHGLIYWEMRGIRVICVIGGRIERNLVDSLQFSWVLCRWSEI